MTIQKNAPAGRDASRSAGSGGSPTPIRPWAPTSPSTPSVRACRRPAFSWAVGGGFGVPPTAHGRARYSVERYVAAVPAAPGRSMLPGRSGKPSATPGSGTPSGTALKGTVAMMASPEWGGTQRCRRMRDERADTDRPQVSGLEQGPARHVGLCLVGGGRPEIDRALEVAADAACHRLRRERSDAYLPAAGDDVAAHRATGTVARSRSEVHGPVTERLPASSAWWREPPIGHPRTICPVGVTAGLTEG